MWLLLHIARQKSKIKSRLKSALGGSEGVPALGAPTCGAEGKNMRASIAFGDHAF